MGGLASEGCSMDNVVSVTLLEDEFVVVAGGVGAGVKAGCVDIRASPWALRVGIETWV